MPSLSLSLLMLVAIEKGRWQDEVNLDAKTRPLSLSLSLLMLVAIEKGRLQDGLILMLRRGLADFDNYPRDKPSLSL